MGYSPRGCKESDTAEQLHTHTHTLIDLNMRCVQKQPLNTSNSLKELLQAGNLFETLYSIYKIQANFTFYYISSSILILI